MNIFLSSFLIISALVLIALGIFGFQYRKTFGAQAFSFLMFAMAVHTIAYAAELLSPNLAMMYTWVRLEYLGVAFYPFLILWLIRSYTGEKKFANRYMMGIIFGICVVTLLLVQTNSMHYCYYKTLTVGRKFGFPILITEKACWYYVQVSIFYFSMGYALIVLANKIMNANGRLKRRLIFVFMGMVSPLLMSIAYLLGAGMGSLDFLPFSYLFLGLFIAYGLYHHDLLTFAEVTHKVIFNAIDQAVIVVDGEGYILKINQATESLFDSFGYMQVGDSINHYPPLLEMLTLKKRQLQSPADKHYQVHLIPIEEELGVIIVFTDITEITVAKKQLEILANTDQLTSLYNRHYFRESFNQLKEEGIIMLLDIDHFKKVNDQYGHLIGDAVLCEFAQCLNEHFQDAVICRYGGEEFIVMIENEGIDQAKERGEAFQHFFRNRKTAYPYTITIGICAYERGNYQNTMRSVDKLLYQGKDAGRNCVMVG